jgi:predicted porin
MKKSLLALAVLGAFAGVASAQSSVTIFGVVDLSINQIKNGTAKTTSMQSNQLNSNRLGFRGVEDLGGGMSAGFWLEAPMSNQDGNPGALNFTRRSTVSLFSGAGEIRLGRDYDPSFWNTVYFDVNGANGIGEGLNLITALGSGASTIARANNSIGYFLPSNLGGVYGQAMAALGQGVDANKYYGGRIGYAAGPIDVAFGYGVTKVTPANDFKMMNIGASWNFGAAKLYGYWNQNKFGALKQDVYEISVGVPLGQGEFRASYGHENASGGTTNPNDANLWSLGYVYNLSKRTALYGGYAEISNKGAAAFTILGGTAQAGLAGHKSSGFNVGMRHSF